MMYDAGIQRICNPFKYCLTVRVVWLGGWMLFRKCVDVRINDKIRASAVTPLFNRLYQQLSSDVVFLSFR